MPGLIEYSEFLLLFELLFRDIKCEDLINKDLSLIKARVLDTVLLRTKSFLVTQVSECNLLNTATKESFLTLTTNILNN